MKKTYCKTWKKKHLHTFPDAVLIRHSRRSLVWFRVLIWVHISRGIYVINLALWCEYVLQIEASLLDCITIYYAEQFFTLRSLIKVIVIQNSYLFWP